MSAVGSKSSRWTIERLRKYQGFESCSDEEAEKTIDTVERLAHILLLYHKRKYKKDEQFGISSKFWKGTEED